jgi:hypothetical protein
MVFPEDMPDIWAKIAELDENLQREDLTYEEKTEHAILLAAALKELEEYESLSGTECRTSKRGQAGQAEDWARSQRNYAKSRRGP